MKTRRQIGRSIALEEGGGKGPWAGPEQVINEPESATIQLMINTPTAY